VRETGNGDTIAYARLESGGSTYEIWLMEADDGGRKTMISTSNRDELAPALGVK